MVAIPVENLITDEMLEHLHAQDHVVEVVDGEIVEVSPSQNLETNIVAGRVYGKLDNYLSVNPLGEVFTDGFVYVLLRNPRGGIEISYIPDVSFVRNERLTDIENTQRLSDGAPHLAVEVVSPTNGAEELIRKVRDYLLYGSEEVWVLYPAVKELHRYRRDDTSNVLVYFADDVMTCETILPGLEIKIGDLFILRRSKHG